MGAAAGLCIGFSVSAGAMTGSEGLAAGLEGSAGLTGAAGAVCPAGAVCAAGGAKRNGDVDAAPVFLFGRSDAHFGGRDGNGQGSFLRVEKILVAKDPLGSGGGGSFFELVGIDFGRTDTGQDPPRRGIAKHGFAGIEDRFSDGDLFLFF